MSLPKNSRALNLGCGTNGIWGDNGWTNIDNSPNARLSKYPWLKWGLWKAGILSDHHYHTEWDRSVVFADLSKGLKYEDASIDFVYTSHFLEHIREPAAQQLIGEIHRVLKPGGLLRIVVPDLEYGARRYLDALGADPHDADAAPTFLRWLQLSRADVRDPHVWMYDVPSLSKLLAEKGFVNVSPRGYRTGRFPDLDVLDVRPDDSLHLEAEKAG